jgi:hypothetical protein
MRGRSVVQHWPRRTVRAAVLRWNPRGWSQQWRLPELGCSNRVVDEVDSELAKLWTWWIGFYGSSVRVRARRSSWPAMARRRSAGGGMCTTEESKGAASGFGDRRRCGGVQVQLVRAVMTFGWRLSVVAREWSTLKLWITWKKTTDGRTLLDQNSKSMQWFDQPNALCDRATWALQICK